MIFFRYVFSYTLNTIHQKKHAEILLRVSFLGAPGGAHVYEIQFIK